MPFQPSPFPSSHWIVSVVTSTLFVLSGPIVSMYAQDSNRYERTIDESVSNVEIANPKGSTSVRMWNSRSVRIVATRPGGRSGTPLDSLIDVKRSSSGLLSISAPSTSEGSDVTLRVFVPVNTPVTMTSTAGSDGADPESYASASRKRRVTNGPLPSYESSVREHGESTDSTSSGSDSGMVSLGVQIVNLNVRVRDEHGGKLLNLTKEDFKVFENGTSQEILHFEPISAPINLVLLIDLSGSTKEKMNLIKRAAITFIQSLGTNDRVAVAAFTRRFMLVSNFTSDRALLSERVDEIDNKSSGTAFYDGLWKTLDLFEDVDDSRKAVVVLSDGVDNSIAEPDQYEARYPFKDLIRRISQEEITIFPIYLDTEYEVVVKRGNGDHSDYVTAKKQLEEMARVTGGALVKADTFDDLDRAYELILSELGSVYSLAYAPSNNERDGSWREISVRVDRARAEAITRRGYYAK